MTYACIPTDNRSQGRTVKPIFESPLAEIYKYILHPRIATIQSKGMGSLVVFCMEYQVSNLQLKVSWVLTGRSVWNLRYRRSTKRQLNAPAFSLELQVDFSAKRIRETRTCVIINSTGKFLNSAFKFRKSVARKS